MSVNFELEYYPVLPQSILIDAANLITENARNWGEPFFMDVYKFADLEKFREVCAPFMDNPDIENLVILGTGGSIQTMMALEGLLKKNFYPIVSPRPRELKRVFEECPPEKTVVIPISRAGATLDINSVLKLFMDRKYPMIALSSKGPMFEFLRKHSVPILPVPDLSGRFAASVCSVALVPAMIGGIDVKAFLDHLDYAYGVFGSPKKIRNNPALEYATYLKVLYKKGYSNIFNMPYSSYLEGLTGLFVQELSESSGKEGMGLLGTMQSAPLCQHSVLELLLGGSKGHTSPLIWVTENEPDDFTINNPDFGLENLTALEIINHQADATFQALLIQEVPTAKISLKDISLKSLAHTIAFVQTTVYFFCMLLNTNWEDNPMVNTGKRICNEAIRSRMTAEQRRQARIKVAHRHFDGFDPVL